MTEKQLTDFIIEKKKLPLSIDDYTNFLVLLLPPMFSGIGISMIYAYYKFGDTIFLFIGGIVVFILGLLFLRFTIIRLKQNITFTILDNRNKLDINQVASILRDNFKLDSLKVDKKLNRILVATKMTWFSWGEKITVVLSDSEILVNSRPTSRQAFTITKDVNNIKKLCELLQG